MPTYRYHCDKCGHVFDREMTLSEHERSGKPACPECQSRTVHQVPSTTHVVTASKA